MSRSQRHSKIYCPLSCKSKIASSFTHHYENSCSIGTAQRGGFTILGNRRIEFRCDLSRLFSWRILFSRSFSPRRDTENHTVSITRSTRRKRIFFLPRFGIVAKAEELNAWSRLVKNCCPFEMGYSVILPRSGGMIRAPFGSGNTGKWCGSRTTRIVLAA